jgi:hypothetical protein
MGREQRSRRRLPPGTFCYLCGNPITEGEEWNRDHVPPQRLFAKAVRKQYSPQLDWLPTHIACNSAYASDEDYFITALVGQHGTRWAKAVFEDIRRGVAKGQGIGLIKTILGQFGKVRTADGAMLFALDANRANRAIWKIVRGLYTLETGRFLPDLSFLNIEIVPRSEADRRLPGHPWFEFVRNTEGLGRHQAVFDYKWLGRYVEDGHVDVFESRGNFMALLFWDALIVLCMFHDPACRCHRCREQGSETPSVKRTVE